jgi:hypothetical protein
MKVSKIGRYHSEVWVACVLTSMSVPIGAETNSGLCHLGLSAALVGAPFNMSRSDPGAIGFTVA